MSFNVSYFIHLTLGIHQFYVSVEADLAYSDDLDKIMLNRNS